MTAVISDSGLDLQPVAVKRESARAKQNSNLHLIAALYPFNLFADPVELISLSGGQCYGIILWIYLH
ncbi:MAG TPA: hypothetical protein VKF63_09140, partial [Terracidiphilus sp.]|nr:hypothetical protein [Terracidiphilus sp.]